MSEERIQVLEKKIKDFDARTHDKLQYSRGPCCRYEMEIHLLKLGINDYREVKHGFEVEGKIILAVKKNKWRNVNSNKWYWYSFYIEKVFDMVGIKYNEVVDEDGVPCYVT